MQIKVTVRRQLWNIIRLKSKIFDLMAFCYLDMSTVQLTKNSGNPKRSVLYVVPMFHEDRACVPGFYPCYIDSFIGELTTYSNGSDTCVADFCCLPHITCLECRQTWLKIADFQLTFHRCSMKIENKNCTVIPALQTIRVEFRAKMNS